MTNKDQANALDLRAGDLKIAVAVARFNANITEKLLQGAIGAWKECGGEESALKVVRVPGAFELPMAAQVLAQTKKYDAVVCLGCVIRGDTTHYDYVCEQAAAGILRVGLDNNLPVMFGVITTENLQQAEDRAGGKDGNKGADALLAAIEMADLLRSVG